MKNLILFICLGLTLNTFSQNAPITVNDTIYIDYNDSTYVQSVNAGFFLVNDLDVDGDVIHLDAAFYTGLGIFEDTIQIVSATLLVWKFSYIPPLNYVGLDSIQYIIADDEIPSRSDTGTIYLFVKHKEFEQLDLNNINARLGLNSLFNDALGGSAAFEVPKGSGRNTIYTANLWIAGKNQDSVYLDAVTYGSLATSTLTQFVSRSGPIMDSIHYKQYNYRWDRLWKITNIEIQHHINNWNNIGYQPIEVIQNWPAHGDVSKGQAVNLAPFVDNNSDGIYNPLDGDYPKIKGQQAIYFIYNDANSFSGSQSGGPTMKSETHYMAYAYNCPSDSAINNTLFLDYTIYNRSNLTYDSTYIGMWTDMDVGSSTSDYMGCDVDRSAFYTYSENGTGPFSYGNYPPAQGVVFLKGAQQDNDGVDNSFGIAPYETINGLGFGDGIADNEYWGMEHFIPYSIGFGAQGDPNNALDYYHYLSGKWLDGSSLLYPITGDVTKYIFPDSSDSFFYGTAGVTQAPWSELTGTPNNSGDRRGMGSTGPFTFEPDSSISITLAFVFGRNYQNTGSHAGVVVMQERIDSIRSFYLTDFSSVCGGTLSVSEKIEKENTLLIYPNPFNNELTINYTLKNNTANLVVYNLIGKQIKTQTITKNSTVIDLSNQPNGIYFITVTDGENRISRKVVKQ